MHRPPNVRPSWVVIALAMLTLLLSPRHAVAQMSGQVVGGPLSTKRFERLLRAYVHPTEGESAALDRLHEAYLDRFRAEIDPELAALLKEFSTGAPSLAEFRKLMRETERLQARIADADRALFDSATELLAEDRRAGFARVRGARERQRALGGFTGMSAEMFGGTGAFVDLADLLARDKVLRAVAPEQRAHFDALVTAQEARLLSQAQRLDRATAKALDGYYEAMLSLQAEFTQPGPDGESAEQAQSRMQANMTRMTDLASRFGEEPRKVLEANFSANRAALTELAGVLPDPTLAELRVDAATRSLGTFGRSMFGTGIPADAAPNPAILAARLRRSGALDQSGTDRSRAIVDAWRIEHARAIEEYVEAMLENPMRLGAFSAVEPTDPALLRIAESGRTVSVIEQKALRALADLAGARRDEFVVERDTQGEPTLVPTPAPESADSVLQGLAGTPGRMSGWFFQLPEATRPVDAREIEERLALLGVKAEARAMIESVVTAWKSRECEARFEPALAAWKASYHALAADMRAPNSDDAAREKRTALRATYEAARIAVVEAYFSTEDALFADLAAALALEADGPEITALRLTRLALFDRTSSPSGEAGPALATPLLAIAQSGVTAEQSRAFLIQSLPAWRELAGSIPTRVRERLARATELERLQWLVYGTIDQAQWNERVTELSRRIDAADRADASRIRGHLDDAIAAFESVDPEAARALRIAAAQIRHPDLHRLSESAAAQLAQAVALEGLDEAILARLEALKAEYDSVFESLTKRMIELSEEVGTTTPERFQETLAIQETLEKLRFQREERTEKARGEARRILGDALASRVRGLVPNEDDVLLGPKRRDAEPFRTTARDDD